MGLVTTDINFSPIGYDSSSEEEIQLRPAIHLTHNQTRRDRQQGDIVNKVNIVVNT
jgi:hypothetical protein